MHDARAEPFDPEGRTRLRDVIRSRSLLTGQSFTLASGRQSSLFFDLKRTMLDAQGANLIAAAILSRIVDGEADAVGGLAMGAVPIVAVVVAASAGRRQPLAGFFVRKEVKDHGTAQRIDGNLVAGARVVILEDVTTTGASALLAVDAVRRAGARVVKVITIVDRQEGAAERFSVAGLPFESVLMRADFE